VVTGAEAVAILIWALILNTDYALRAVLPQATGDFAGVGSWLFAAGAIVGLALGFADRLERDGRVVDLRRARSAPIAVLAYGAMLALIRLPSTQRATLLAAGASMAAGCAAALLAVWAWPRST
jgi:hypothetical protein